MTRYAVRSAGAVLAGIVLAAGLAAGCGGQGPAAPRPAATATCINVQHVMSEMHTAQVNAQNDAPVPPGARWPEAQVMAGDPQYVGNPGPAYWTWLEQKLGDELSSSPLPACP
jgi:hypothetical protein